MKQEPTSSQEYESIAARLDAACIAVGRWIVRSFACAFRVARRASASTTSACSRGVAGLVSAVLTPPRSGRRRPSDRTHWSAASASEVAIALPAVMPPPLPAQVGRAPSLPLPYRRAQGILTKGERAAWIPLSIAIEGRFQLFCKVRLADVVECPPVRPGQPHWFKRIRGYHVDFVVCELGSTAPLLVIELDDRSHLSSRSIERDRHKDEVLRAAGVPILRIRAQQAYSPDELLKQITKLIVA